MRTTLEGRARETEEDEQLEKSLFLVFQKKSYQWHLELLELS